MNFLVHEALFFILNQIYFIISTIKKKIIFILRQSLIFMYTKTIPTIFIYN